MKATAKYGDLYPIPNCSITIAGTTIPMYILPDISDAKGASYTNENVMGRSFPLKAYSHSDDRTINMELHFVAIKESDIQRNLGWVRLVQSAVYPQDGQGGSPYSPPPICKLICGQLLGKNGVCAILKNYSVKYATDMVWDSDTLVPYKIDMSTTWEVLYASSNLPGQQLIVQYGS